MFWLIKLIFTGIYFTFVKRPYMKRIYFLFCASLIISSCKKEGCTDETANNYNSKAKKDDGSCTYDTAPTEPKLIFVFDFDSTQVRLDNFGMPSTIPYTIGRWSCFVPCRRNYAWWSKCN